MNETTTSKSTLYVLHLNGAPIMTLNGASAQVRRHRPVAFGSLDAAQKAAKHFWSDHIDIVPMPVSEWAAMVIDA